MNTGNVIFWKDTNIKLTSADGSKWKCLVILGMLKEIMILLEIPILPIFGSYLIKQPLKK